jgi:hypothetical protein
LKDSKGGKKLQNFKGKKVKDVKKMKNSTSKQLKV